MKYRFQIRDLTQIALFSAVITLCAWLSVPIADIPFTLQLFGVYAALFLLGSRKGFYSVLVYLLMGLFGLPVFANFRGGISAVFSPTGGYILGLLFLCLVHRAFSRIKPSFIRQMSISLLSLCVCYTFGSLWFYFFFSATTTAFPSILAICVFPYLFPDIMKILLAYFLTQSIKNRFNPFSK